MPPVSFPVKLWNTLNTGPNELIRWSGDGTEVYVNEDRFEELIEQYPSFLRQRTLSSLRHLFAVYQFHREDRSGLRTGWTCYSHPYFLRGQTTLLELFVLSHQTRRHNMRKVKTDNDDECKRCKRQKTAENFTINFVSTEISDSKDDDLQPICSSALFQPFQVDFGAGMDEEFDSSATEQSPFTHLNEPEAYRIADCSSIIDTDIDDSDCSFGLLDAMYSNSESWMNEMNENDEWFGMKDQPLAVPVSSNFGQHNVSPDYANLVELQHYDGVIE